jgi:long-chain acyl-CoA synthetase
MALPPNVVTLVDLLEFGAVTHGPRALFGTKRGENWVYATYAEVKTMVDRLRGGLAALGVSRGDRVGIIANNRLEWAIGAYATYGLGGAFVPMYESQLEKDWVFIIRDSGLKVLFVATPAIEEKVRDLPASIPTLKHVVRLSGDGPGLSYADLLEKGEKAPAPLVKPEASDLAGLIYTSGTTGDPKGVLLSHGNVMSNIMAVQAYLPFDSGDRSLAFLPWAHSFGHTAELHLVVSVGASLGICDSTDKILQYLTEVRPTILFAVPRIFNRIYAGVQKQIEGRPKPIQALFQAGLAAAGRKNRGQSLGLRERLLLLLAQKLVFTKVVARFGGRLKYTVSGAAALAPEVAEFVDALGIKVYEGYGLTETSPIVSSNVPGARKMGSVGKPIPGVRVVIDRSMMGPTDESGEIVVYGPNVMQGYHNRPEETRAVFTADGGFRTGDLGYLDDEGYLFITGRIKEQYKLENGKFVAPAPLEEKLKLSPFIANVMIYGDNKPFNVAVVAPNLDIVKQWATSAGVGGNGDLLGNEQVRAKFKEEIDKHSTGFKGYERVRAFFLVGEDFTQQNDLLTPKLSLKRRNVMQKWGKDIARLYE